ncbi:MAG: hypothetical protein IJ770_01550 [Alphaproteobacteria bacterium]|nr:hypothetical protein [Alphaproteobacteria bacterium]
MNLVFITCSGTNEFTDIEKLVALMQEFPLGEIAVQVSEKQSPKGGARLEWVRELAAYLNENNVAVNAALHVNRAWVEELCRGVVVPELQNLLRLRDIYGLPLFKRLQLNFKLGRDAVREDCDDTVLALQNRIKRRFILSYNESNARLIRQLYLKGLHFDCLFDSSFGAGIAPDSRQAPVFTDILQGYAGGISPDNVETELGKIAKAVENSPTLGNVYIDAQKGLEDEQTHLSLDKCRQYLDTATAWYRNYQWKSAEF